MVPREFEAISRGEAGRDSRVSGTLKDRPERKVVAVTGGEPDPVERVHAGLLPPRPGAPTVLAGVTLSASPRKQSQRRLRLPYGGVR